MPLPFPAGTLVQLTSDTLFISTNVPAKIERKKLIQRTKTGAYKGTVEAHVVTATLQVSLQGCPAVITGHTGRPGAPYTAKLEIPITRSPHQYTVRLAPGDFELITEQAYVMLVALAKGENAWEALVERFGPDALMTCWVPDIPGDIHVMTRHLLPKDERERWRLLQGDWTPPTDPRNFEEWPHDQVPHTDEEREKAWQALGMPEKDRASTIASTLDEGDAKAPEEPKKPDWLKGKRQWNKF